jgi:hypothetical protein
MSGRRYFDLKGGALLAAGKAARALVSLVCVHAKDVVALLCITAVGIRMTAAVRTSVEVDLFDETYYLVRGIHIPDGILLHPQFAPLYNVWYYFLSFFTASRLELYYLNVAVLGVAIPVLLYVCVRRWRVPAGPAFFASFVLAIAFVNIRFLPKVSHFALAIVLVCMTAVASIKSPRRMILFCGVCALALTYVRPEFFLTYIALTLAYCVVLVWQIRAVRWTGECIALILFFLASTALVAVFGSPLSTSDSYRGFFALAQHMAANWKFSLQDSPPEWKNTAINPWQNWLEFARVKLSYASTAGEIMRYYPKLFARHVMANARQLAEIIPVYFIPCNMAVAPFLCVSTIAIGLYAVTGRRYIVSDFRENISQSMTKTILFLLACFQAPTLIMSFIIFPEFHYIRIFASLCVVQILLVTRQSGKQAFSGRHVLLVVCCAALGFAPLFGKEKTALFPRSAVIQRPERGRANARTIETIALLNIQKEVRILPCDKDRLYAVYLGNNFTTVQDEKVADFFTYMKEKDINMIILDEELLNNDDFALDAEWHAFLDRYADFGFVSRDVAGTTRRVLLKKDLLPEAEKTVLK